MTATAVGTLFVVLHAALFFVRLARLNGYGPSAIVFMAFVDVFFAAPVYLDVLIGPPDYGAFAGITAAAGSDMVLVLYCTIVLALTAAFIAFLGSREVAAHAAHAPRAPWEPSRRTLFALTALTYLPLAYVLATGRLDFYRRYAPLLAGADLGSGGIQDAVGFINVVNLLLGLAVLAGALIIRFAHRGSGLGALPVLLAVPALLVDVWLMGKRSIVAYLALMIGVGVLDRARHRIGVRHGVLGLALAGGLLLFSSAYQRTLRPDTQETRASAYANFRIDMGRDHDLKLVLHDELSASVPPILGHRMQSFLFLAAMPVPREVWADKPWPFAVYLTSRALEIPVDALGWGITTDLFSESIANLGLLGLVPCCLFFIWAVRRIDRSGDPVLVVLGTLSICSLVVLQFTAVAVWHLSLVAYVAQKRILRPTLHHA